MARQSNALATLFALLLALCASAAATAASYYDPPGRVARLGNSQGDVSFSPDGGDRWYDLERNRPLIRGDQVWTDRNSRAELQVGSAMLRLDEETNLEFLELDDRLVQVQVSEGSVNLRVRRMYPGQSIEVDTPNLAFVITQPGRYRIDVDYRDDATTLVSWQGNGMVYGVGGRFPVRTGDAVRFWGEDLRDYEVYGLPRADSFDRYCFDRDRRLDRSTSLRYLGDDVVGYSDLDDYGRWNNDPRYGSVWYPDQVDPDWAPYRAGQWIWQDRYDWTWVDDEPWGFAPSHYGRWAFIAGRWGWIPGPRNYRPVYAPALVVFIGGGNSGPSVGWFPLGPRDVYMPSYPVSQNYFTQVNVSNTVVNNTTIINNYTLYNSPGSRPRPGNFANRTVANAVTVVPRDVFVNSRPVRPAMQRGDRNFVDRGPIARAPMVGPAAPAARAPRTVASIRPPRELRDREVVARNQPSATPLPRAEPSAQQPPGQGRAPGQERRRNLRVISAQANAVDARAAGPRGEDGSKPAPQATLAPLDRTAEPKARGHRRPADNATPPPASSTPPTSTAPPRDMQAERDAQAARDKAQQDAQNAREQAQRDAQSQRESQAAREKAQQDAQNAREQAQKDAQAQRDAQAAREKAQQDAQNAREQAQKDAQAQRDAQAAREKARQEAQAAREQAQKDAQAQRDAQAADAAAREQAQKNAQAQRDAQAADAAAREQAQKNAQAQRDADAAARDKAQKDAQAQRDAQAAHEEAKHEAAVPTETPPAETPPSETPPADAPPGRGPRADCVSPKQIERMKKRGMSAEEIAKLTPCPAEPPVEEPVPVPTP